MQGKLDASVLYDELYNELRRLARARLRHNEPLTQLDTTALVHESYLRLANNPQQPQFADKAMFFGYASRMMRSIVVDFVRTKHADRHGGDALKVTLSEAVDLATDPQEAQLIRVSEALDELACVDERATRVVEMRYFAGLTEPEIAEILGVTERTVRRDWDKARMLLRVALA